MAFFAVVAKIIFSRCRTVPVYVVPCASQHRVSVSAAGTSGGRVQQKACGALLELAAAAGGEEGCAVAERPEVQVLLDALRSPVDSVRDAALRVSRGQERSKSQIPGEDRLENGSGGVS